MGHEESRETRLREGDRRHAVECAAAQADGDRGCKYKKVNRGPGSAVRQHVAEGFAMMSECSQAADIGLIPLFGLDLRRPEGAAERREL
jgi:hypothetical protein